MREVVIFFVLVGQSLAILPTLSIHKKAWWVNAVIYQIYPLSFQDSDGNGYGDLRGILSRVDYLKQIGVSAVWLTPIYESPMKDNGYDVSNYTAINPIFGTMDDFVELERVLEDNDIKIIMDLVPNHTSDKHNWFKKSVEKEGDYTDYYIWHKPKSFKDGKPVPPNNWIDWMNAGSAWEWSEQRQEFYLHNFLKFQPDLNYRCPKVVQEFKNLMKFWFDKGVDGFRIDAVPYIFKDKYFRDEPLIDPTKPRVWDNVDHIYTNNQPEVFELIKDLGEFVGEYIEKDKNYRIIFIEAHVEKEFKVKYYSGYKIHRSPRFVLPFNFFLESDIDKKSDANQFKSIIDDWMSLVPQNDVSTWIVGHHDEPRVASKLGEEFVDAMNMISFTLPGVSVVYYGEEIGMHDTFVPYELSRDYFGLVLGPNRFDAVSRDFHRTPMQWNSSVSAGFSSNITTWLPVNANYWDLNVAYQQKTPRSHLKIFQDMVHIKKKSQCLARGNLEVLAPNRYTLIIKRMMKGHNTYILVVNTGYHISRHQLSNYGAHHKHKVQVVTASHHCQHKKGDYLTAPEFTVVLRPKAAVLVKAWSPNDFITQTFTWIQDAMKIAAEKTANKNRNS